jgi:hypothetical protein
VRVARFLHLSHGVVDATLSRLRTMPYRHEATSGKEVSAYC